MYRALFFVQASTGPARVRETFIIMDTANPILGNPLLLIAILLFLAILPRALRQKEKTELDKAVERFEKEELKTALSAKHNEDKNKQKKPIALKDGTLAYPKRSPYSSQQQEAHGGIPPFPAREEDGTEKVKIVKPGIPISHLETAEPPKKKKIKLIKQEFSIAPDENRKSSKKTQPEPTNELQENPPPKVPETSQSEDFPVPSVADHLEASDSWIEAEIPGLTPDEPPTQEETEDIPVFNAFPKEKYRTETEDSAESPENEKQATEVKNIEPETEEKEDPKLKELADIETDSPELEVKNSESESKEVEIKAPVASHKSIATNEAEAPDAVASSSPETGKIKPFLLDLKYLDPEEPGIESPAVQGKLPGHIVDAVISRLNVLQADLENQLTSLPGKRIFRDSQANGAIRNDRVADSVPDLEKVVKKPTNQKEVSVEELDSFLFTATQRKSKE